MPFLLDFMGYMKTLCQNGLKSGQNDQYQVMIVANRIDTICYNLNGQLTLLLYGFIAVEAWDFNTC